MAANKNLSELKKHITFTVSPYGSSNQDPERKTGRVGIKDSNPQDTFSISYPEIKRVEQTGVPFDINVTNELFSGWQHYNAVNSTFAQVYYYREGSRVFLQGLVKKTNAWNRTNNSTIIFVLPPAYTPPKRHIFTTMLQGTKTWPDSNTTGTRPLSARVDIEPSGIVRLQHIYQYSLYIGGEGSPGDLSSIDWLTLDGINFSLYDPTT